MKYILLLFLYTTSLTLIAQENTGTIKGEVVSPENQPIANVAVYINQKKMATTNKQGAFLIDLETGEYILAFKKDDITMTTSKVKVYSQKITEVFISLQEGTINLKEIMVLANKDLFNNAVHYGAKENKQIPGGNNLIHLDQQALQRSLTLKDALKNEPGIIIQEFFGGNDQPRLNIRGSGIQSNPQRRGINLLQDGIPFNFSDGSYIINQLNPQTADLIEVYRGANGLAYGAANLGGALNLISKTGYTTPLLHVKAEAGSFDFYNVQLEGGMVSKNTDVYASFIKNHSNGFREFNESSGLFANLNIGYKFNPKLQTRFYTSYTESSFDVTGPLNKKMMQENPKQISLGVMPKISSIGPHVLRDKPRRDSKTLRFSNKSIYKLDNHNFLTLDLYYQNVDDVFHFPISTGVRESDHNDYGINFSYTGQYGKHYIKSGITASKGDIDRRYSVNIKGEIGKTFADNLLKANNIVLYAEDNYTISPQLKAIAAIQFISNHREIEENFDTPSNRPFYSFKTKSYAYFNSSDITYDKYYTGFNPRIGLLYEPTKQTQYFLNISKSYEPPTFDEILITAGGNPNQGAKYVGAKDLDAQSATSIEIGSRGENTWLYWSVSAYRSWVYNEILTTTDLFGISGKTRNSPDTTIHQGLELGLTIDLLKTEYKNKLKWHIIYNYSDFSFEEGIYKGKQIAGIPEHYVTSAVDYVMDNGFFVNINLEYFPTETPTDHQNTVFQDPYNLWGGKIGLKKKKWSIYAEVRNIFNENYASSYLIRDVVTDPPPPNITADDVTTFIPGVGTNFNIGLNFNL